MQPSLPTPRVATAFRARARTRQRAKATPSERTSAGRPLGLCVEMWRLLLICGLFATIFGSSPAGAEPARITRVERYASEKAARIVLHVSRPVIFRTGPLDAASGS